MVNDSELSAESAKETFAGLWLLSFVHYLLGLPLFLSGTIFHLPALWFMGLGAMALPGFYLLMAGINRENFRRVVTQNSWGCWVRDSGLASARLLLFGTVAGVVGGALAAYGFATSSPADMGTGIRHWYDGVGLALLFASVVLIGASWAKSDVHARRKAALQEPVSG